MKYMQFVVEPLFESIERWHYRDGEWSDHSDCKCSLKSGLAGLELSPRRRYRRKVFDRTYKLAKEDEVLLFATKENIGEKIQD